MLGNVVVSKSAVGLLVTAALDQLWYQQQREETEDEFQSCCPFCEARCAALLELYMAGQLGEVIPDDARGPENGWWSVEDGTVSYDFLDKAWGWGMGCCDERAVRDGQYRAPGNWVARYNREFVAALLKEES